MTATGYGTIHHHQHATRFGQPFTIILIEGAADDVAAYDCKGHVSPAECLARGTKWTARDCAIAGITIPKGKVYRA